MVIIKGATSRKHHGQIRYAPSEFYMKRGDKAYFRNEYGKWILSECKTFPWEYGKKYTRKITHLIGKDGEILATRDW